jgi:hypothetical protein
MQPSRFEQVRIQQLVSPYSPAEPPRLPLDFGDYLSLLWRADAAAARALEPRTRYYRRCADALADGLGLRGSPLFRLVELTPAGSLCAQLANLPYRLRDGAVDAPDRKAAIAQLCALRGDLLRMGTYQEHWSSAFPGAGILDPDVRERVFAVLFTAMQGQFGSYARLLFVVDIVLGNLLTGQELTTECPLDVLVSQHGWPDPAHPRTQRDWASEPHETGRA